MVVFHHREGIVESCRKTYVSAAYYTSALRIDQWHRSTGSPSATVLRVRLNRMLLVGRGLSEGSRRGGWHSSFDLVLFVEDPSSWMVSITRKMPMYIVLLARRILNSHWTKTVTATTPIWPSIEAHLQLPKRERLFLSPLVLSDPDKVSSLLLCSTYLYVYDRIFFLICVYTCKYMYTCVYLETCAQYTYEQV